MSESNGTLFQDMEAVRNAALEEQKKVEEAIGKWVGSQKTADSFQNFLAQVGIGTDSLSSGGSYGFNPITRIHTLLEWIHRGSWIGGLAVDIVADDMTRAGIELGSDVRPQDIERIDEQFVLLNIWGALSDGVKWSRLYGGALIVFLIDKQDFKTPLKLDSVTEGQFKGLFVLDRWMVEPDMSNLITELGPHYGLPMYYKVRAMAPGIPQVTVHYSRCIRLEGIRVPYWQRVAEMMWGISVLERLYDRLLAFDSATQGAAQLVYKSYIRTYRIKGLRAQIHAGNDALAGLIKYVDMMRRFQSIEGITLLDAEDEFEAHTHQAFGGLSDALIQFGQQLSGALQIPLVRLFGQSPAGLNSTGESDLRTYYDGIKQRQERDLKIGVDSIVRMIAQSSGIKLARGFLWMFRDLWQLTLEQKAAVAAQTTGAVVQAVDAGLVPRKVGLEELRQSSRVTGVWSNISDEDIKDAEQEPPLSDLAHLSAESQEVNVEGQRTNVEQQKLATQNQGEEDEPTKPRREPNGHAAA